METLFCTTYLIFDMIIMGKVQMQRREYKAQSFFSKRKTELVMMIMMTWYYSLAWWKKKFILFYALYFFIDKFLGWVIANKKTVYLLGCYIMYKFYFVYHLFSNNLQKDNYTL